MAYKNLGMPNLNIFIYSKNKLNRIYELINDHSESACFEIKTSDLVNLW